MDRIDKELLRLLASNARMPLNKLAQQVFLSSPAVASRIEKLEREGIIRQYTTVIDYNKLGYPITVYISLQLKPNQREAFYNYIEQCSNVLECNGITGQYSIKIKAVLKDTHDLDDFLAQLTNYGQTKTEIVFSNPIKDREFALEVAE